MSGAGHLVVKSGASGSLGEAGCSLLTLSGVTFVNEGTTTLGASGGVSGQLDMHEGARLENTGTFNADSYPAGCVPGSNSASIQNNGGSPVVSNTGTFNAGASSGHTVLVSVPLDDEGAVHVASGELNPTGGGSSTGATWTTASGTEVTFTTGSYSLAHDTASGAKLALSGGTLTIATGTTTVGSLGLTGGTLSVSGTLDVASSLVSSSDATVSGSGSVVIGSGASGSFGEAGCSLLTLSGVTLVNEGTTTLGASGGVSGQLDMQEGARLENTGTFNADSYSAGCVPGSNSAAIQNNGGSPAVSNAGTFNAGPGSGHTASVSVAFNNDGAVHGDTGTLQLSGGGIPEHVASGSWEKESGASIVLSAGTFLISEAVDLSQVEVTGATVERVPAEGPPSGSLSSLSYAAGTVEVAGSGHANGAGFASAAIEVTPLGAGEWHSLCGSLTPGLGGEFGCAWNTLSGSYADGDYQLRGRLTDSASPPASATTAAISVLVDNTAPTGSLTPPSYIGSASAVTGIADDAGSGVASWQLQIAPAGHSEWADACAAQSTPSSGDDYTCTVNTSGLSEGAYALRAVITDRAGNTHTTSAGETTLDTTAPSGSLGTLTEYERGTVSLSGTGSDAGSGVATWTPQIAAVGGSSWANACAPQSTPISGSTYGCSLNTTGYTDGAYQLRAVIADNAGNTHTTSVQDTTIDNTPPTGSLDALGRHSSGTVEVRGPATDALSGVAGWQLEIKPTGSGSWENACLAQSVPLESDVYGCSVDTTLLTDGSYQLRATLTDNAGNTHATSPVSTHIDNHGEEEGGSEAGCTDVWTGLGSDDSWQTAENWSAGVPGSSDRACIPSGATAQIASGTNQVASLAGEGTLQLTGGTLEVTDNTTTSELASLEVSGGTLTGAGTVEIYGGLSWSGGVISGSGETVLTPEATSSIDPTGGSGHVRLEEHTLANYGTLTLAEGSILMSSSEIENTGTFKVNSESSGYSSQIEVWSGTNTLTNTGTVEKTAGSGATTIGIPLHSTGTINATSGHFGFPGSTSVTLGTGSILKGQLDLEGATVTTTADVNAEEASIVLSGGSLNLESGRTFTVGHYTQSNGTVEGAGTLALDEAFTWTGGTMAGSGQTVIPTSLSAAIEPGGGSGHVRLEDRTLVNHGTLTLAEGAILMSGAEIENTGTFKVNSESSGYSNQLENWSGTNTLVNTGTVEKTTGTGTTKLGVTLNNEGTLNAATGHFALPSPTSVTLGTGSTLKGSFALEGASVTVTASVNAEEASIALSGGLLSIASAKTLTVGHYTQSDGTVEGAGTLALDEAFTWTGGTMSGSGQTVIPTSLSAAIEPGSGSGHVRLEERTLVNHGTLTLAEGAILMTSAQIENTGTFKVNSESSGYSNQLENWSGTNTLVNTGTVEKTTGTGTTKLGVTLNNEGTLDAATGHFAFPSPTSITLAGGSTLTGSFHLEGASVTAASFNGTHASLALSSGTLSINTGATPTIATLTQTGGTLQGAGTLGISEALSWSAGTMSGSGETTLAPESTSSIDPGSGSAHVILEERTLLNEGALTFPEGTLFMEGGAHIQNTGYFDANSQTEWYSNQIEDWSGTVSIDNTGTFQKTTGTGTTRVGVPFNNDGSVKADTGQLLFTDGGIPSDIATGTWTAEEGATIKLTNGTFLIGSSVDLSQVEVSGATVIREGSGTPGDTTRPSITGTVEDGQTLSAHHGEWSSSGTITYAYQWEGCDTHGAGCHPIAYATGETYTLESGNLETSLRVLVTATNSTGSASVTSAVTTTVASGPPVELEGPAIFGAPNAGQVLYAEAGVWGGTDVGIAVQWELCNSSGGSCTEISGATRSEYEPTESDIGYTLRVSVHASNELGSATATSSATAVIGAALTLANTTPPTVSGTPQSASTLTAHVGEWTGSGTISYAYQWQACDKFGADCEDITGATASTYTLSEEDVNTAVRVIVTASDANGSQALPSPVTQPIASATAPVVVVAPSLTGTYQEGHTLSADTGEWSGAGTLTYAYQWVRCDEGDPTSCADIPGATSSSYLLSMDDVGSTVRVLVTATGSGGSTSGVSAPSEPIAAATLFNTAVPTISGTARSGDTLSADPGLWEASSSIEYAYQWMRCDSEARECTAITGATASTYTLGEEDVAHTIEVVVTATGTWGVASVPSDPTSAVLSGPTAPENTVGPSVARYANEGETLTVEPGTWEGTAPLTYTYQWQRCYETCSNISGATSSTYTVVEGDVGQYLNVIVTATNAVGSASASTSTELVGNSHAPAVVTAPTINGEAKDQQLLTMEPGEWSGSQPIEYAYQWERCNSEGSACADISGASSLVYGVTSADIGHTLRVKDTATSTHGATTYTTAATALAVANPASGATPTITGADYLGNTLTAHPQDVTGTTPVEAAYQWERCNSAGTSCTNISGASASTYTLAEADVGSTLRVTATYSNGYGSDSQTSSHTATVQDTAPSYVSGLGITRSTEDYIVPGVVLTAHPGTWNGSATIEYAYQWQRCTSEGSGCTNISGASSASYTIVTGDEEKHLQVIVSATNAHGTVNETSGGLYVRVPQAPGANISPTVSGTPEYGQTLTEHSEWTWDPTSITYQWQRCEGSSCTNISGASSQTYTLTGEDLGYKIRVAVTATNAIGSNTSDSSRTTAVHGVTPVNTELPGISGEGIVGAPLEASPGTWTDAMITGESVSYEYQWQLCNSEGGACHSITGATHETYAPPGADLGLTVRVVVTALSPPYWEPGSRARASATSAASAPLTAATAAANTTAPVLSGTAQDGDTLSTTNGAWTGSPTIEYSYQWQRCNTSGASCTDIEGAIGSTYEAEEADIGHTLRAVVTATNGAGPVSVSSSHSETVAAPEDPPSNITPPSFRPFSEQRIGEEDFIERGTWTNNPAVTFQWQRCDTTRTEPGTEEPVCTNITGATQSHYVPQPADIGYVMRVVETATNPSGTASATSEPEHKLVEPLSIGAEEQEGERGGTYTGALVVGQTITANSTVASTPELPVTTLYTFSRGGTVLQEGSSASYTLTSGDLGHEIKIKMVSTVWRADHEIAVGTDTVIRYTGVVQVAPTNDTLPSIAGEAVQGATLTATSGEWHGGGGTLSYAYQWRRCNTSGASCTSITGATSQTYTSTAGDIGHTIRVMVTAANQGSNGMVTSTHTATITAASAPANTAIPTITGEATDLQTLTAHSGEWSGSAPIAYAYQWEACDSEGSGECTEIVGATEASYRLQEGDVGETMRVTVTASNGAGAISAASSNTGVVAGAPAPVSLTRPSLTLLGLPQPGASVTTDSGTWQNIGIEPALGALTYQWERCASEGGDCHSIVGATSSTYNVVAADDGERLRVTVTAQNETGQTSSVSPMSVQISETTTMGSEKMLYTKGSALYIANPSGTESHEFTSCPSADLESGAGCTFAHPRIAPDGEMVAVTARPAGAHGACGETQLCPNEDTSPEDRILLMDYNSSEPHVIPGNGSQPAWSPDGTSLTYARTIPNPEGEGTITRLYRVKADGSDVSSPVPVETATAISESPAYSPDGSQLAYVGRESTNEPWDLYTAGVDGHEATRIHVEGVGSIDDPQYTTDGRKIIFIATEAVSPHAYPSAGPPIRNLYSINTNGTDLHKITEDHEEHDSPVLTPENEIIFVRASITVVYSIEGQSVHKNPGHIESIPIEGGTPTPLPEHPIEGVKDLTIGVLGPHAHKAATQVCPGTEIACGTFNGAAAAAYALKWYSKHNESYPEFGGNGGDCTNFASQALVAGGMKFTYDLGDEDDYVWYMRHNSRFAHSAKLGPVPAWSYSSSFVRSQDLWNHLILATNLGYQIPQAGFPGAMAQVLRPGDLLFEKIQSSKDFDHTQIVVQISGTEVWVAQHSGGKVETIESEILKYHNEHKRLVINYVRVRHTMSRSLLEE